MSHEIQALKNRIKRTEGDVIKLQSEFEELLDRIKTLEINDKVNKRKLEIIAMDYKF